MAGEFPSGSIERTGRGGLSSHISRKVRCCGRGLQQQKRGDLMAWVSTNGSPPPPLRLLLAEDMARMFATEFARSVRIVEYGHRCRRRYLP